MLADLGERRRDCRLKRHALEPHVTNYYEDNEDLQFYMDHEVSWEPLVSLVEHDFKSPDGPKDVGEAIEGYRDVLRMVGEFVAEQVAPHVASIDRQGLKLVDGRVVFPAALDNIFAQIKELGLHGMCLPRELGGMNCPVMVYFMASELFARADVSVMTHHGFHGAIGLALLLYSISE